MNKADSKILGALHGAVAASILAALKNGDRAMSLLVQYEDELPEEVVKFLNDSSEVSPALLTVATKFLKDNDITCDIEESLELSETQKLLAEKAKKKRVSNVTPFPDTGV